VLYPYHPLMGCFNFFKRTLKMIRKISFLLPISMFLIPISSASGIPQEKHFTNSLGMKFIRMEPGSFMRAVNAPLPDKGVTFTYEEHYNLEKLKARATWKGLVPGLVGITFGDAYLRSPHNIHTLKKPDFDTGKDPTVFSRRWYGMIKAPVTGEVRFEAEYDSGLRLIINGEKIINDWKNTKKPTSLVNMKKGRLVPVILDYSHTSSRSYLHLYWAWQGHKKHVMPADVFWHTAEHYNRNKLELAWAPGHSGTGMDGRYLLHGRETWYYRNGRKRWEIYYAKGDKTGTETYWRYNGTKKWQKEHRKNGTSTWILYEPDGKVMAKSRWRGKELLNCQILKDKPPEKDEKSSSMKDSVAKPNPDELRILCVGDSITEGSGAKLQGGFRGPLKELLTEAGVKSDFVGRRNTPGIKDGQHEAAGGRRISSLTTRELREMFKANQNLDIILLLIGINDLIENRNTVEASLARMSALLDQMARNVPHTRIIVGNLIPNASDNPVNAYKPDEKYAGSEDKVLKFNKKLPAIIKNKKANGINTEMVDLHRLLTFKHLSDGIHPGVQGHNKIAKAYFEAIIAGRKRTKTNKQ